MYTCFSGLFQGIIFVFTLPGVFWNILFLQSTYQVTSICDISETMYNSLIFIGRLEPKMYIWLTIKVCNGVPWKASISLTTCPLVEIRIILPSGLNFMPVQSQSLSWASLNVANGPCNTYLKVNQFFGILTSLVWKQVRLQSPKSIPTFILC